jgi:hypothetical protein
MPWRAFLDRLEVCPAIRIHGGSNGFKTSNVLTDCSARLWSTVGKALRFACERDLHLALGRGFGRLGRSGCNSS